MGRKTIAALFGLVVAAGVGIGIVILQGREKPVAPTPVIEPSPTPSPSPTPRHILRAGEQAIQLRAVGGYGGDGVATRLIEPGHYLFTVEANIPDPPPGKFYEAYLDRASPESRFSAGKLTKKEDIYVLTLDQARDASSYLNVIITLEEKDDKISEIHVLEGEFVTP